MPVALDPNDLFEYVLLNDRAKPKEEQPTFLFHFPTCRERKKIARLFDELTSTVDEAFDKVCEGLRIILAGWRNVRNRSGKPIDYDPSELDNVISANDLFELRVTLLEEMDVTELDKKKLARQSLSNTEKSVSDAVPLATV